jgi:Protein of unknown function (DUF3307)
MISLALKLLIAHIMGDFVLQPYKWVLDKEEKKQRSPYLYWHMLVHTIALLVVLQFNMTYWLGIIIIIISHWIIDIIKLNLNDHYNRNWLFFADQVAHLIVLAFTVHLYLPFKIDISALSSSETLLFIAFVLMVTAVSSVIMKVIISKWNIDEHTDNSQASLSQAGTWIGILERLMVFGFVILNQWEGIGFLLAAKSIFRFGDIKNAKDRKLTEYILIGTLLSFGLAIGIGLGYVYLRRLL